MCAERLRRRAHAPEGTLGLENPALGLIIQVGDHDLVEDLLVNRCILDRYQGLDPAVQVAGHPVRRGNEHLGFPRSEEHTSELQSLMRISYAVFCLKKKKQSKTSTKDHHNSKLNNSELSHK